MQVLDDHGRVFGKINIIDAVVLFVLCLLIPLAYGAYLLFRASPPLITAIEPARAGQGLSQITIRGEHLRPYLRIGIGAQEGPLLFENPSRGIMELPPLKPGSYDVALYDESQELQRLVGMLVIEAPPLPPSVPAELMVSGAFRGLDARVARTLASKLRTATLDNSLGRIIGFQPAELSMSYLPPSAVVVSDGTYQVPQAAFITLPPGAVVVSDGTYQVRAVIQLRCVVERNECKLENNAAVVAGAAIPIAVAGQTTNFTVDEIYSALTRDVRLTVRVAVPQELAEFLASAEGDDGERFPARIALRPSLVSLTRAGNEWTAVFRVPAVRTSDGWLYRERVLRVGEQFSFESPLYQLKGAIMRIAGAP